MKKLKEICLLFICLICITVATSCKNEVEEAERLSEEKMNSFNSYTMSLTAEMLVEEEGRQKAKIDLNGSTKVSNIKSGDYIYYTQTSMSMHGNTNSTVKQFRGYQDGYMYEQYSVSGGRTTSLVSNMSRERFEKYLESENDILLSNKEYPMANDAYDSEITSRDDGRKMVVLSGFNDEFIDVFNKMLEALYAYTDSRLDDAKVTILLAADYSYETVTIDFIFTESKKGLETSAKFEASYYNYDLTEIGKHRLYSPHEVEDLDEIYRIKNAIRKMFDTSGGLNVSVYSGDDAVEMQKDDISWGKRNKKFWFEISRIIPEYTEPISITYSDGLLRSNNTGHPLSAECTDFEARSVLETLILGASINPMLITDARRGDLDGEYIITLSPQKYHTIKITITMDGDKITKIEQTSTENNKTVIKSIAIPKEAK